MEQAGRAHFFTPVVVNATLAALSSVFKTYNYSYKVNKVLLIYTKEVTLGYFHRLKVS